MATDLGTMIGTTLSHYRITDKLGEGGMGEVYRAEDVELGRAVAIKVLPERFAQDALRHARFEREAKTLAALNHPNIATLFGLEHVGGKHLLIMELVEGEGLDERIAKGPIPVKQALQFAVQIAEAIEAAHENGVVHRDLKPSNIKIRRNGAVKVLDFGLAKGWMGALTTQGLSRAPSGHGLATDEGRVVGTPIYMSPEQARGAAVDRRADIWAFGAVLWEMLTGRRLFGNASMTDILAAGARHEPDWSSLPAALNPLGRRVLRRCLEQDPEQRFHDMGDVRIGLEDTLAGGLEAMAVRAPAAPTVPPWRRTLPWALLGVAAVALVVGWALAGLRPHQLRRPVRLEAVVSRGPLWTDLGSSVVLSPDGSQLALVARDRGKPWKLLVRSLAQLDPVPIAITDEAGPMAYHPFFSPDGQWLGFATPRELRKVPVNGGTPITLCRVHRSRGATWLADGSIVFTPSRNAPLFRVPATGGEPEQLTTLDEKKGEIWHHWPHGVPGAEAVVFTVGTRDISTTDQATIDVVSVDSGERKTILRGGYDAQVVPTGYLVFVRDETLFAAPFDLHGLEVTGPVTPIVRGIASQSRSGGAQYSFSGNGTLVYVNGAVAMPSYPVVWVDRDGVVSSLWSAKATYASPAVSPDGGRLAVSIMRDDNWDVWVYDLEREVATRLTSGEAYDADQFWSRDGTSLYYTSDQDGGVPRPYRMRADGSGEAERLTDSDTPFYPLSVSPDNKILLGATDANGSIDVAVLHLDEGGEPEPYIASSFVESEAQFSPDGRWVAYVSNESGGFEVYVRPFEGEGGRRKVSDGGGRFPTWAANGRELFYRTDDGIMVAATDATGGSLQVGKARLLFSGSFRGGTSGLSMSGFIFRDFAVSPDGARFVMFPGEEDGQAKAHVTLVFNWFDELARTLRSP